jgi:hypothetical protein
MPYLVIARRVQGRWRVEPCPACRRTHTHASTGQHTARCGATYIVVGPSDTTSVRAATMGTTPTDDGPAAA